MKDKDFRELLESIDQARDIHQGRRKPSRITRFEPVKIAAIRKELRLTQSAFAKMICVSLGTLRNWEQGRTQPDGPALALLRIAEADPKAVLQALHAA